MADPWEEALDLDDSDLSSLRPSKLRHNHHPAAVSASQPLLRRCSLPQTQSSQNTQILPSQPRSDPAVSPRLIPGPAGTVQAAMLRRPKNPSIVRDDVEQELIPTQEYIRRAVEEGIEDDDDFARPPWINAVDFIRRQGLADEDGAIGVPLSAIKSAFNTDKVAQVVAIVKSSTPNGLGGLMVTLKDPTGTIDATIHGRVLSDVEFGKDISIGAVIIIRKVAIFSPSRSAHYLNITLSNMVKVFSKDVRVPMKQSHAPPMIQHGVPVNVAGHNKKSPMQQKPSSLPQGTTEEMMHNPLQNKEDTHGGSSYVEQSGMCKTTNSCHSDGKKKSHNASSCKEQPMTPQNADDEAEEINSRNGNPSHRNKGAVACEQLNNLNPSSQAVSGGNMLGGSQSGSSAVHLNSGMNNRESGNGNKNEGKQPINSSVSVPEWTDEQLDELFSFD